MIKNKKTKYNSGAAMLISVIFFLFISLAIIAGLVSPSVREFKIARDYLQSRQSFFLSESAIEDAYYRINNSLTIGSTDTLTIGSTTATATIVADDVNNKTITSLGDLSSRQRTNQLKINSNSSVTFLYGTQAGGGGVLFGNNSYITGNLYSNGNIVGGNNNTNYITGSAYAAGSTGTISALCIGGVSSGSSCDRSNFGGSSYSHIATNVHVADSLYCQTRTGNDNNQTCNTSQADPVAIALPVTQANINTWEADAAVNTSGSVTISTPVTLGPVKINGNLSIVSGGILTIANTIWVTGSITLSGTAKVVISPNYNQRSAVIIADGGIANTGLISLGNNVTFDNTSTTGSYLMFLSTSTCDESNNASPCSGHSAIEMSNNSTLIIANAQNGTVSFAQNANAKEIVGQKIRLANNASIEYGTGSSTIIDFSSGTNPIWRVSSWLEI